MLKLLYDPLHTCTHKSLATIHAQFSCAQNTLQLPNHVTTSLHHCRCWHERKPCIVVVHGPPSMVTTLSACKRAQRHDHLTSCARISLMYRQGRYNLDPNIKFLCLPPVHGALRKYVDHPAEHCFKLPDSLTYEQGALVEPLSVAGQTDLSDFSSSQCSMATALTPRSMATLAAML